MKFITSNIKYLHCNFPTFYIKIIKYWKIFWFSMNNQIWLMKLLIEKRCTLSQLINSKYKYLSKFKFDGKYEIIAQNYVKLRYTEMLKELFVLFKHSKKSSFHEYETFFFLLFLFFFPLAFIVSLPIPFPLWPCFCNRLTFTKRYETHRIGKKGQSGEWDRLRNTESFYIIFLSSPPFCSSNFSCSVSI